MDLIVLDAITNLKNQHGMNEIKQLLILFPTFKAGSGNIAGEASKVKNAASLTAS
jgi:hypothetical protein